MSYNTKQRTLIADYLKEHGDSHLTADMIEKELSPKGVGRSTVYRCLEKLVNDGLVRKYLLGDGKSACYQYVGGSDCRCHFHLKCLECGILTHLECEHLKDISEHIRGEHGFSIDNSRTVFYGLCEKCGKYGEKK